MNQDSPLPYGAGVLTSADSARVADALIAAIDSARAEMVHRHEVMCANMENNHWTWLVQYNGGNISS